MPVALLVHQFPGLRGSQADGLHTRWQPAKGRWRLVHLHRQQNAKAEAPATDEVLGKRKDRWSDNEDEANGHASEPVAKKQSKIVVPEGVGVGGLGTSLKAMEETTGAKISIHGKGAGDGAASEEPLHVVVEGTDIEIATATKEIEGLLKQPEAAVATPAVLAEPSPLTAATLGQPDSTMAAGQFQVASTMPAVGMMPTGDAGTVAFDEMHFEIPNEMVGVVIGRGGENIQKIQREYGVNIQIAKAQDVRPGATTRPVTLKGPKHSLVPAKAEVDKLIMERQAGFAPTLGGGMPSMGGGMHAPNMGQYGSGMGGGGMGGGGGMYGPGPREQVTMPIPNDKVGLVIGKQGGTIKGIQMRTSSNIQVPPQPDMDDPTRRTITIAAPSKMQIDLAMREVQNVIDAGLTGTGPTGGNTVILQVPNDRVGLIIGKAGATIKELQNRSGARIQIPPQSDPGTTMRSVSITGVGDAPMRAKYEMEQMLMGFDRQQQQQPPQGAFGGAPPGYGASPYGQPTPTPYGASPYGQPAYGQPQPYGMPAAQPAYSAYGQQYQQPDLYAAQAAQAAQAAHYQQQAQQQQAAAPAPAAAAAGGVDLTQYHTQFWQYAAYYGERVAREQYGAWAPPVGTPPPAGIVLPAPGQEQPAPAAGQR
ncbi:hypothetical protein JKP88DRAFT_270499 [Tribonema minus]|uniref:K Homology domain-containing protein n=1 Tax=Tribonema minus TaxID=303371 RepID=A0A835YN15_9STRA|nr:hypothetical protein JKP88DRAFT_270499 [Tribonema minus]